MNSLEWWSQGFSKVVLIQPSSATVEILFPILKRHFAQSQQSALQDYVEVGVMLEINNS